MNAMNCESCDPLLVDLALGELDEATTLAVRAHADDCDACSRALARMTAGRRAARELVLAPAPDLSAVLAAARAKATEIRAARASEPGAAAPVAPVDAAPPQRPRASFFDEAFRWLGAWAARPQVAMATVFLLMVGIGLWHVPQLRWHPAGDAEGAMIEPDTSGEPAPSGLDPAAPLALDVDPHTRRVALEGEQLEEDEEVRDLRPTTEIATAEEAADPGPLAATTPRERATPSAQEELAVADVAAGEALGRVEDGPLPEVSTAPSEAAIAIAPSAPGRSTEAEGGYYDRESIVAQAETTTALAPPAGVRPMAPVMPTAPSTIDGVTPSTPSAVALLPNAIHRQARSLASSGHCAEAIPRYETLLRDHAGYADAPRAMLELAECQRRIGRLDAAATWIARAERFPSVSTDARRARIQLQSQIEALERPTDDTAAASQD